jgi:hypothetical protein
MMQLAMDGCAVRAYITGLKADVLRAPDKKCLPNCGVFDKVFILYQPVLTRKGVQQ